MNRTVVGIGLVVLGIAIAAVSGFAHEIGLTFTADEATEDTFGGKQVAGIVVGIVIVAIGLTIVLLARGRQERRPGGNEDRSTR